MTPRRIVLDSNVIISAFLFGGMPARILGHVVDGDVQCFVSVAILDEVRDVLRRPKFGLSPEQALSVVEEFHEICQVVGPMKEVRVIDADPDDDMVLECALAASAEFIVSGDKHLLDLGEWEGIQVVTAAQFAKTLMGQQEAKRTRHSGSPLGLAVRS